MPPRPRNLQLKKQAVESRATRATKAKAKQDLLDRRLVTAEPILRPLSQASKQRLDASSTTPPPQPLTHGLRNLFSGYVTAAFTTSAARTPQLSVTTSPKSSTAANVSKASLITAAGGSKGRVSRRRKRTEPFQLSRLLNFKRPGYSSLGDLRTLLGLAATRNDGSPQDAVLVSIDTESERRGLIDNVVEVGITTLLIADIYGTDPGDYARNWTAKMEHKHMVLDVTRKPKHRMRSSLFGKSIFVSTEQARAAISETLQHHLRPPEECDSATSHHAEAGPAPASRRLILVGQSIVSDIVVLKGRPLHLDLHSPIDDGEAEPACPTTPLCIPRFSAVFDTLALTQQARKLGVRLPGARLGLVARVLGVDPKYWDGTSVVGTHNASNDAAYTMMVLLLHAIKAESLEKEGSLEALSQADVATNAKGMKRRGRAARPSQGLHGMPGARPARWRLWRVSAFVCVLLGVTGSAVGITLLGLQGAELDSEAEGAGE
ncbi:hypothetical protein LTR53_003015 [Teratosphaeriaceae sp. CCFEE 6253]|nr:hypothetical protein LTR53_003015 [Teratosphaeriaceae sp. CCFEE 6253]